MNGRRQFLKAMIAAPVVAAFPWYREAEVRFSQKLLTRTVLLLDSKDPLQNYVAIRRSIDCRGNFVEIVDQVITAKEFYVDVE